MQKEETWLTYREIPVFFIHCNKGKLSDCISFNVLHTWREYVWVEADVETCVADGTHCLACIQDHLLTFGVCCE